MSGAHYMTLVTAPATVPSQTQVQPTAMLSTSGVPFMQQDPGLPSPPSAFLGQTTSPISFYATRPHFFPQSYPSHVVQAQPKPSETAAAVLLALGDPVVHPGLASPQECKPMKKSPDTPPACAAELTAKEPSSRASSTTDQGYVTPQDGVTLPEEATEYTYAETPTVVTPFHSFSQSPMTTRPAYSHGAAYSAAAGYHVRYAAPPSAHLTHAQFPLQTLPYFVPPARREEAFPRHNSCHICGKTYARQSTLKTHLRTHNGEKPYQCSVCQKSFTQAANLTAHLRTHSGEKPFKCPVCNRGFSQSSSVTTHMRTHSGERPYKCNVCGKGFADSSTLTKHYRTHTGEKPYQCKICEARFSQSGNLNRHMRTHRNHFQQVSQ